MALEHLRLEDMSDRELLLVIDDLSDADGYVDGLDVASQLGMTSGHPRVRVAQRLSWLVRFGVLEREHERDENGAIRYHQDGRVRHTQRWGLTDEGRMLAHGQLRKGTQSALDRVGDDQLLVLTRWLARRPTTGVAATLARREWQRETTLQRRSGG